MATISATQQGGDRFDIEVRGHRLVVDQPQRDGGPEAGPSPTELFVASLAACVGHYAARFLRRHDLPYDGLRVDCDWTMRAAERARVSRLRLEVSTPAPVPAALRGQLQEAMEHCTVHNTLLEPPPITISLAETGVPAGAAG